MYEDSYGLRHKPFGIAPDPQFLFLTAQHREAATGLIYAILKHRGLMTFTGEAGTGKTTVIRAVLSAIGASSAQVAYVPVPTLSAPEFLEFVLLQFGLVNLARANKAERLLGFERFLLRANQENRTAVLIVDEAHKLSKELLEEIRLLTNYNTQHDGLIQVVLAGQTELDELLRETEMAQLKQRIAYRFTLRPLAREEVREYIAYRWSRAGGDSQPPFEEEALEAVARYSGGIPRLINAICDNALMMAFGEGTPAVSASTVHAVARELDLASSSMAAPSQAEMAAESGLETLELAVVATEMAGTGELTLDRRRTPQKGSWLSRSARRLLMMGRSEQ
ncbi:MAG: ExeA family protein [Bryobacteraceae bacterium]